MTDTETNWKEIALALAQRVNFAVQNCECTGGQGSGGLLNIETGAITAWRYYMAEALEMIPGVKVDKEILDTMYLPRAKRVKVQKEILAARVKL